jgi:hypothetical protein
MQYPDSKCFKDTELGKLFVCPCNACAAAALKRGQNWDKYRQQLKANVRNFWTGYTPRNQAQTAGMYGGFEPTPLTDEEKQEMEGCGC